MNKFLAFLAVGVLALQAGGVKPAMAGEAGLDSAAALQIGNQAIDQETQQFLQKFKADPKSVMDQQVQKFNANGQQLPAQQDESQPVEQSYKFGAQYLQVKDKELSKICQGPVGQAQCLSTVPSRRGIASNDLAENLVDNAEDGTFTGNLFQMAEKLTKGKTAVQPWSSDYWPIASGETAKRYADDNWPDLKWGQVKAYYAKWFAAHGADPQDYLDTLSPAEKYDMVVGDTKWTLTNSQLDEGSQYASDGGKVETWMGICHGWAPAAYMVARPRHTVTAHSPTGLAIKFRPDDIKALASLKWANGQAMLDHGNRSEYSSRFIGGRCNLKAKDIQRDPTSGAVINDDCFDTNPGSWHKTIVNQIGIKKRSFVIDATWDYEVWNQPMLSYSYTYFNPSTMQPAATVREAMVPAGFQGDKFASVRNRKYGNGAKRPANVVGVIMESTYIVETDPSDKDTDDESQDETKTVRYKYDLEIAADGEILGGEWYENDHPDFMWTPAEGSYAWNDQDAYVTNWSPAAATDTKVTRVAQKASADNAPLKAIVDGLIDAASK